MGATLPLTAGRTGGHLTVYQVGDLVRQVFPEACTMHALRAVQVLMSHWSIATTERYLAVDDEVRRREAVRAVSDGATGVNRCPVASFVALKVLPSTIGTCIA